MALKERKGEYEATGNANYHKGEHTSRKDAMTGGFPFRGLSVLLEELASRRTPMEPMRHAACELPSSEWQFHSITIKHPFPDR